MFQIARQRSSLKSLGLRASRLSGFVAWFIHSGFDSSPGRSKTNEGALRSVQAAALPLPDLGFGVWCLGFGVWGLGFGVWILGIEFWGLGFGS